MTFKTLDHKSVEKDFTSLIATLKADLEYYNKKVKIYDDVLDRLDVLENKLPDDDETINKYYDLRKRIYDNYYWITTEQEQLENYLCKLDRLSNDIIFFYEYN